MKLFELGEEMAPDEGGVFWDFHMGWTMGVGPSHLSDMYYYLSDKARKILRAKKYFLAACWR